METTIRITVCKLEGKKEVKREEKEVTLKALRAGNVTLADAIEEVTTLQPKNKKFYSALKTFVTFLDSKHVPDDSPVRIVYPVNTANGEKEAIVSYRAKFYRNMNEENPLEMSIPERVRGKKEASEEKTEIDPFAID